VKIVRLRDYQSDRIRLPPKTSATIIILPSVRIERLERFARRFSRSVDRPAITR
jgi:hypothetical protein